MHNARSLKSARLNVNGTNSTCALLLWKVEMSAVKRFHCVLCDSTLKVILQHFNMKNEKKKTHKWGRVSLYPPPTVRRSRIKLVSCKMLRQHDDWTSFEREATEEGRCKNTSTTGTLVTFNMTHQTPASYKDILITEVIMSVPISPSCGNLSFLAQLPQSNGKSGALWWQDKDIVWSLNPPAIRGANKWRRLKVEKPTCECVSLILQVHFCHFL